ncbi:hypothetical protein M422DRAFT_261838 [Sphaerobolus stellatus SS14]|uniref:Uncharacterized protein n=1 Tax=Sphaerobolus stellatus (strain SS14) TaxID=990650 RepID=A0A0C9TZT2_SPHS4|nr:hypothetical protein M422DRAFT_261838 [Sphaerobolus stellatus SS14]
MPLDYAHPEIGSATLSLARLQSSRAPRIEHWRQLPGGPGESDVEQVKELGSAFNAFTKGQYDVVGWDPRGFNQTSPTLTCGFRAHDELQAFFNGTIINDGIEVGNFTGKSDLDRFF